jgi:hypothetical protein
MTKTKQKGVSKRNSLIGKEKSCLFFLKPDFQQVCVNFPDKKTVFPRTEETPFQADRFCFRKKLF